VVARSFEQSRRQHARARQSLAGGVATAFRSLQLPVPISFARAAGSRLWDIDGNEYVDYALAFGPLLLGHSPEVVVSAVERQLRTGLGYGASHRLEAELSEAVCRTVPSAELCVFNSTGSEAVASALRIARAATGRSRVVKFLGHYHGWFDGVHVGVPGQSVGRPGTLGQDPRASESLTVCPWNDEAALEAALGDDVAAVIMEPLNVNGGAIRPMPGYLERVRELSARAGAVLIFDEVITGYRVALGGAQHLYGVTPDLTVLGKAVAAGFPLSVVCGRADVMEVAASGRVAHVGTFNANPVCAAAALAAISFLEQEQASVYPRLEALGSELAAVLSDEAQAAGLPLQTTSDVGVGHAFMAPEPVTTYAATLRADGALYRSFAGALLEQGVHVIPRGLLYVSTEHTEADLAETREAVRAAAATLAEGVGTSSVPHTPSPAHPPRVGR
jgi:glutamate-1-semialdehyde 2,1-aminomutase